MAPTRILAVAAVAATALALVLIAPQTASAAWTSPNSFAPGVSTEAIAVDSSTNIVYVGGYGTGGIRAVNGTSHKSVAHYSVKHSISDLATDSVNGYVVAAGHFGLAIVKESTKAIHISSWDYDANGVGVDPTTGLVFLGGSDENGNDYVSSFSETTGALIHTINVSDSVGIAQIAVDTVTHMVYVVGYNSGWVTAINESTFSSNSFSAASGNCYADNGGCGPSGIAVDSTTGKLYVSSQENFDGDNFISVINVSNGTIATEIPVFTSTADQNNFYAPGYMAVDPTANVVYSIGYGAAVVINGATNAVIKNVPLGKHFYSVQDGIVAANSTTGVAYVASDSFSPTGKVYTIANVPLPLSSSTPKISGQATIGTALTATPGTWTAGTALAYQWKANGTAVASGGTSSTYTVGLADAGKKITVSVTGSQTGYATKTVTSSSTKTVPSLAFTADPVPTISGTLTVGSTLTAAASGWTPAATYTYKWYRSGSTISGATASTYQLTSSDRGKKISVHAYGHSLGYTTTSKSSASTATIGYGTLTAATPTITGIATVGQKLTAVPGAWGPTTVTFSYVWLLNGHAIKGQTKSTLKVPSSAAGGVITVTVRGSKSGYTAQSKTSKGTSILAA
jgi:hypothetical protein